MIQSSVQLETIGEQLLRLYRDFLNKFEIGIIPQIIATKGTPFLNRTVRPQNTENSGGDGGRGAFVGEDKKTIFYPEIFASTKYLSVGWATQSRVTLQLKQP